MKRTLVFLPLAALLFSTMLTAQERKSISVLIITGDHQGDWKATTQMLQEVLADNRMQVSVTAKPAKDLTVANLARYDAILLNYRDSPKGTADTRWSDDNKKALASVVASGKGLIVVGQAGEAFSGTPYDQEYAKLVAGGCRTGKPLTKDHLLRVLPRPIDHPIIKDLPGRFTLEGELIGQTPEPAKNAIILAEGAVINRKNPFRPDRQQPIAWVAPYGKGRVYHLELGTTTQAIEEMGCKTLLIRGIEWAATGKVFLPVPDGLKQSNSG